MEGGEGTRGRHQEGLSPATLWAADSGQVFTWSHPWFWALETTETQHGHEEFTAHEKMEKPTIGEQSGRRLYTENPRVQRR